MNRTDALQQIIDGLNFSTYLEIGVANGDNFFSIKATEKTAVDPEFRFPETLRKKWMTRNVSNLAATYHQTTSDAFFESINRTARFDLVFIDGLHTFAQSLRDVVNSLEHLNDHGAIMLHDCNPSHPAAAHPADSLQHATALNLPGWTGAWCGDVWKTICHLRCRRADLKVFVLDCDHGLGIITKGTPDQLLDLTTDALNQMTFADLVHDRTHLLNLREEKYLSEFLETFQPDPK